MNSNFKDYLKLHFVVLILGFTAILGRLVEVSSLSVVFYRTLIAALGMWVLAKIQRKNLYVPLKEAWGMLGTGTIMAIHWLCFFGSARVSTIAVSLVTISTASFFTSIVEPLSKKQKISKVELSLGIVAVIGIYIIFSFEFKYLTGILLGIFGGFLASIFSVLNANFAKKHDGRVITFYEMTGAFFSSIILIPLVIFMSNGADFQLVPSKQDWIWIAVLALGCTVYPYTTLMNLLKKFSAYTLNLSINMEPIYGIILAYLVFGDKEKMTWGFYLGGLFILLTVALHPFLKQKETQ